MVIVGASTGLVSRVTGAEQIQLYSGSYRTACNSPVVAARYTMRAWPSPVGTPEITSCGRRFESQLMTQDSHGIGSLGGGQPEGPYWNTRTSPAKPCQAVRTASAPFGIASRRATELPALPPKPRS